jgi:hypothetical protein
VRKPRQSSRVHPFSACGIKALQIGKSRTPLSKHSPLYTLSGFGDTVRIGDHVNLYQHESGERTLDARNVRITYLDKNDLGYESAYKDPNSSNTSCSLQGANARGLWHREFELVRSQQAPYAKEELVRPWITQTLMRFGTYLTPTKRLNKAGKQVADRVVLAFCHWKGGVRMIRLYNPEIYYIQTILQNNQVIGLEMLTQTYKRAILAESL